MDQRPLSLPVVLVVEDEPLVRALAVDVLEEAGFEVIEAPTADYAVGVLDKRSDIRVIFTDVDMPGRLNGFQLARLVQDHYHRVNVIVSSGKCRPWPSDIPPGTIFLGKPYTLTLLVEAVRRLAA
jgi:two-component system, response regulator PdtaR